MQIFRSSLLLFILLTFLSGGIYPVLVTAINNILFPHKSSGSIVTINDINIGSKLIGQYFHEDKYFWGRPSATDDYPYNGIKSGAANLGPANPKLKKILQERIILLNAANPDAKIPIPSELVFSSASGLDPDISLAAALYQVPRVAKARDLNQAKLRNLIYKNLLVRTFGFLGEPRINVLSLNINLDKLGDVSVNNTQES